MTRIHLISDVHNDFGVLNYTPPDCDVVILAGDIAEGPHAFPWIYKTYSLLTPVIYIAGNHEFYGYNMPALYADLRAKGKQYENVHFLQNECLMAPLLSEEGVRFICATLWTDFKLGDPLNRISNMHNAARAMNDYRHISYGKKGNKETIFTPTDAIAEHEQSLAFIEKMLSDRFEGTTVVVTHHAPSAKSCMVTHWPELDPAYASDLEHLMLKYKPALWVHGHMHQSRDYMIGSTRVVANPRGYAGRETQADRVDLGLIIEI